MGIDKNKDIGNSFDSAAIDKVGKNVKKQLKINKFKLFVFTKKNQKNSCYKTFPIFFYSFLIFLDLKSYNPHLIIYNLFVDLD